VYNRSQLFERAHTQVLAWEAGRKYGIRVNTIPAGPLASRAAITIKKVHIHIYTIICACVVCGILRARSSFLGGNGCADFVELHHRVAKTRVGLYPASLFLHVS